jgi:hypothetical protein
MAHSGHTIVLDANPLGLGSANGLFQMDRVALRKREFEHYHEDLDFDITATPCDDPSWCSIPMPKKSHFSYFDPPIDKDRWKRAQILAKGGKQVLLRRILQHFPAPVNFLDGDVDFKSMHSLLDVHVNEESWFAPLAKTDTVAPDIAKLVPTSDLSPRERNANVNKLLAARLKARHPSMTGVDGQSMKELVDSVPAGYKFKDKKRAPILSFSHFVFEREAARFEIGKRIGKFIINYSAILPAWLEARDAIDTPFVAMSLVNENWGLLSTSFPNRTVQWGESLFAEQPRLLSAFLDDNRTLMLVTNQHSNISHPKILTVPRGLPLGEMENSGRLVWDAMRGCRDDATKKTLLVAMSGEWGPSECLLEHMLSALCLWSLCFIRWWSLTLYRRASYSAVYGLPHQQRTL